MAALENLEMTVGMPCSQSLEPAFLARRHSSVSAPRLWLIFVTSLVRMRVGGEVSDGALCASVYELSGGSVPDAAASGAFTVTPARRRASMNRARAYAAGSGAKMARWGAGEPRGGLRLTL